MITTTHVKPFEVKRRKAPQRTRPDRLGITLPAMGVATYPSEDQARFSKDWEAILRADLTMTEEG